MSFERAMTRSIYNAFAKAGDTAAEEYEALGTTGRAFGPLEAQLERIFRTQYEAIVETFGSRVFDNRKLSPFRELVFRFYSSQGAEKVRGITETTRKTINRAIRQGEGEGLGVSKTAKLIKEKTQGSIGRARAATIARTETHAAASYATHEATKELGLPAQRKRWVSVSDGRTRSHHAAANGQEVGIEDAFKIRLNGVEIFMKYPHDGSGGAANNINCRCLAIYFTDEDALFEDLPAPEPDVVLPPVVSDKPVIDLANITAGRGYFTGEEITALFNGALTPLAARVVGKLPLPTRIRGVARKAYYDGSQALIVTHNERQIINHEYGHHIDREIGRQEKGYYWSPKGLKEAWEADRKAIGLHRVTKEAKRERILELRRQLFDVTTTKRLLPNGNYLDYESRGPMNFDGADGLSDIIDSFVGGIAYKDYGMFGHGKSYWKRTKDNGPIEAFANMVAIVNQPAAVAWAESNIPNLWKAFIAKLEMIDGSDS